jgi:transcriptional antiterminator
MRVPKKPSGRRAMPFYWWRRFKTHKSLPYRSPLITKIKNGDFDYSPYFQQAEWELHWMKDEQKEFIENYHGKDPEQDRLYMDIELRARKRYNKLIEDAFKDENEKLNRITDEFCKNFKINKEDFRDLISKFDGSLEKLYIHCQNNY